MDGAGEGTPFGRYRLIEVLGRGGMGEVWRAFDTVTKRTVAIKVLPAQLGDDDEFAQRFRREAEAAAGLNSPHVIPIHDYGEIDERHRLRCRNQRQRQSGAEIGRRFDQAGRLAVHRPHQPQRRSGDTAGGVYVADTNANQVLRLAAGWSSQQVPPFTGLDQPSGVAVDAAGNVYITDNGNNRVLKLPVR